MVSIAKTARQRDDSVILITAFEEDRVVLTRDKDFGELVFHQKHPAAGVVLLRHWAPTAETRLAHFQGAWPTIESKAQGNFIVISADNIRVRPLAT